MPDTDEALMRQNAALTRQMLEWIASGSRSYAEVLDTWRSTCPRHTVWEDAVIAGLVDHGGRRDSIVGLTPAGLATLKETSKVRL